MNNLKLARTNIIRDLATWLEYDCKKYPKSMLKDTRLYFANKPYRN